MKKLKALFHRYYPEESILKIFIRGSFWSVYGNVVVKGFSLLASMIIARLLGSAAFGELSVLKTTLSVFSLFATFGLGITVTKFVAEKRKDDPQAIHDVIAAAKAITVVTGSALGLLIVLFAPSIAIDVLHTEVLINPLRISGIFLFFNALNVYQVGVIAGLDAFKDLAKINFVVGIVTVPIVVAPTYFFELDGAFAGLTAVLIINWYLNKRLIDARLVSLGLSQTSRQVKANVIYILKFSYPLAIKEIIYSGAMWTCFYLLLIKTDYAEVGIFNSANQLSQLILFLPASILNVFLSLLTHQNDNHENYTQLINKNILFTVLITLSIGLVLYVFSGIIYSFYGTTYEGGKEVLGILILATVPMALIGVFEQICISNSRPKLVTIFQFVIQFLVLAIAYSLFAISKNATSLAYAFFLGQGLAAIIMYVYIRKVGMLSRE